MANPGNEGFLLVDKPAGLSSHDVVSIVRRARGGVRAGHTGTLDPFATGLLLVALGRATRLIRFVPSEPKVYDATVVFGAATDTDDATGNVVEQGPVPDERSTRDAIAALTGALEQVPPAYSAKHVDGRRAYVLARLGEQPALAPVPVVVERWDIREFSDGQLHATLTCSSGTYVRALARDLGRRCGTVAHLGALRRTRIGPFEVGEAIAPDESANVEPLAAASALAGMNRQVVSPDDVVRLSHGRAIAADAAGNNAALVDESGDLVAVAEREGDWWRPRVVMRDA
jgi:tRNA pseudouridine55 synthase